MKIYVSFRPSGGIDVQEWMFVNTAMKLRILST